MKYIPIFVLSGMLLLLLVYGYISNKHKKTSDLIVGGHKARNKRSIGRAISKMYSRIPYLRKYYYSLRDKISALYPADVQMVDTETGKILLKASLIAISFVIWPLLMFLWLGAFDPFYLLSGILVGIVAFRACTTGKIRKLRRRLWEELQSTFSRIRHYYHQTHRVDDSVSMSIRDSGEVIHPHLENIKDILSDPETKRRTGEYSATRPEKHLLMFLTICSAIKEYGDRLTKDGRSVFLTTLGYLKNDIDSEILAEDHRNRLYEGALLIVLTPVVLAKPLEKWAITYMPQTAQYYTGIYASVSMMLIFTLTYVTYMIVDALSDDDKSRHREDSVLAALSSVQPLSGILATVINSHYTRYMRIDSKLRGMGDHTGVKAFLLKKILFGIAGFAAVILITAGGTVTEKINILSGYAAELSESPELDKDYLDTIAAFAEEETRYLLNDTASIDTIKADARAQGYTEREAGIITQTISDRYEQYNNTYYRWEYVLAAIITGILFAFIPDLVLAISAKSINARRQDEVMQFQLIMLILMYVPGTTVATALEWMERFSTCFAENITTARINLGAGERDALLELRESEEFEPFRIFVDGLLAIDNVGTVDAFDEIASDHEYYMSAKTQAKYAAIEDKAAIVRLVRMVPFWSVLVLYLLLPVIRYIVDMFTAMNGVL